MADQNAEQNAPATTGDAGEQGEVSTPAAAASDQAASDNNVSNASESAVSEAPASESAPSGGTVSENVSSDAGQNGDQGERSSQAPSRFSSSQSQPSQGELLDGLKPMGEVPTEKKEVADGRAYEIVFIVRNGQDDDLEAITGRARDLIEGAGGAVDNLRTSEARRLAYPIEKETEGRYVVANARFSKGVVSDLDRFFKLEEGVLRHLVLREDD
jgi:small subunit ribosomal protein S6